MGNEKRPLRELMSATEERLKQLQYSQSAIDSYWVCWHGLLQYAAEKQAEYFTVELGENYLAEQCHIDIVAETPTPELPKWKIKLVKRAIYVLAEFQNSGAILRKNKSKYSAMSPRYTEISEHFYAVSRSRYNSEGTIVAKAFTVKGFLLHLEQKGIYDIAQIQDRDAISFLRTTVMWAQRTVATTICNLRQFLSFLYEENYMDRNISQSLPLPNHGRGGKLPNVWTPDAVQKVLDAADRANPVGKRNYAILLLVTQLGLRDSDIQNLKFENLFWKECRIRLVQTKTKRPLELPLTEEIGNAIIDYLKYGRPKQDVSDYVFVRHSAPYGKCGNYYHIMKAYLPKAGVSFDTQKTHGLHTLRHTLATRLLEQDVPLQTISEILGHACVSSTKIYLQIDLNGLRKCAINPDEVYENDEV